MDDRRYEVDDSEELEIESFSSSADTTKIRGRGYTMAENEKVLFV